MGKIRLSQTPWLNHSWHVALYVTARGLTTSPISSGERVFQIDLDFIDHACFDLLMNWEKQHQATGGSLVMDWETLTARFRQAGRRPVAPAAVVASSMRQAGEAGSVQRRA